MMCMMTILRKFGALIIFILLILDPVASNRCPPSPEFMGIMNPDFREFCQFIIKFNRHYESDKEFDRRFTIFKQRLRYIAEFNKEKHSYSLRITRFTDFDDEEISKLGMHQFPQRPEEEERVLIRLEAPDSLDWGRSGMIPPNRKITAEQLKTFTVGAARCSHLTYGFAYLDEKLRVVQPTDFDFIPNDYYGNFKYMSNLRNKAPTTKVKLLYGIRLSVIQQRWMENERMMGAVARKLVWHTRNINFDGMFLHMDADLLFSPNLQAFFTELGEAIKRDSRFYNLTNPLSVVLAVKSEWAPHVASRIALIRDHLQSLYLWADDTVLSSDSYASSSAVSSVSSSLRGVPSEVPLPVDPTAVYVDPLFTSRNVDVVDTIRYNAVTLAQRSGVGVGRMIIGLSTWTRSYLFPESDIAAAIAEQNLLSATPINATLGRRKREQNTAGDDRKKDEAPSSGIGHGSKAIRLGNPGMYTKRRDGRIAFYETCEIPEFVNATVKDHFASTASFVSANSSHWYSLNLPRSESLGQKLKWISKLGFRGVGLFSLQGDDNTGKCSSRQTFPLHQFVSSQFRCRNKNASTEDQGGANTMRRDACKRICSVDLEMGSEVPNFSFDNLDSALCSHVVVAPIFLHTAGQVVTVESTRELIDRYEEWVVEGSKPRLILSIGSAQNAVTWRNSLASAQVRDLLIDNVYRSIDQHNAHGVEISWTRDGPENADDSAKLTAFVHELRQRLNQTKEIFVSAVPIPTFRQLYDFKGLGRSANYIVVQGYKFHLANSSFTGHHSPLFADKEVLNDPKNSIEGIMEVWSQNVKRSQLIVGLTSVPMSQRFLPKVGANARDIGDLANVDAWRDQMRARAAQLKNRSDELMIKIGVASTITDVCKILEANDTNAKYLHPIAAPYVIKGNDFIALETAYSVQIKTVWTMFNGFAGLYIHSIGADNYLAECPADAAFPLLKSIANAQICPLCGPATIEKQNETSTTMPEKRHCGRRTENMLGVICHYDAHRQHILSPLDIPAEKCTQIVIRGAFFDNNGKIVYQLPPPTNNENIEVLQNNTKINESALSIKIKKVLGDVTIIQSVTCPLENEFPSLMANKSQRAHLVQSIHDYLELGNLNGIEIDCDHILDSMVHAYYFNLFLRELHENLNAEPKEADSEKKCAKTIYMRMPVWQTDLTNRYDVKNLNRIVDLVTMEQWPHFPSNKQINRNVSALVNPLFFVSHDANTINGHNYALDQTVRSWISCGLSRNRIVIPVTSYGISLSKENNDDMPIFSSPTNMAKKISYAKVCESVKNMNISTRDIILFDSVVGFALTDKSQQVSYENKDTIQYKAKYAQREGLAGIALMSLQDDDKDGSCNGASFPVLSALISIARKC